MSFPNVVWGSDGMQFWTGASQGAYPLGTIMQFNDGREYVYCEAAGTALEPGKVMSSAAVTSGHTKDLAIATSASIGDTTVYITNSTTAITADMYAEGYMFVNDVTGEGHIYKIKSNNAESTGTGTCTLTLEEGSALRTALTAGTSQVGLRKHPCKDIVVAPTTEVGVPVGVATCDVTENYFCWVQRKGPAAVLTNGTVVLGMGVQTSETTAGAVDPQTAAGDDIPIVGHVLSVAASTEYSLIDLCIP